MSDALSRPADPANNVISSVTVEADDEYDSCDNHRAASSGQQPNTGCPDAPSANSQQPAAPNGPNPRAQQANTRTNAARSAPWHHSV